MVGVFDIAFIENLKIFIAAILIYTIIYAMLKQVSAFGGDGKINSLIALLAAIIVSFSGVVTYAVSYAINWFVIVIFMIFLVMTIYMFLGGSAGDIAGIAKNRMGLILGIVGFMFIIISFKSFFAINNAFDTNNPQDNMYEVDPSFNTGVDDVTNSEFDTGIFSSLFGGMFDSEMFGAVLFLLGLGGFVMILGRG